jgi:hypothetical protein
MHFFNNILVKYNKNVGNTHRKYKKIYGVWGAVLTSVLDGDEWSASCPSQFTGGAELLISYLLVRRLFGLLCWS